VQYFKENLVTNLYLLDNHWHLGCILDRDRDHEIVKIYDTKSNFT